MAVFARTPEGHLQVLLSTGGQFWAQYAYQFSHELCHHLCRSDGDPNKRAHLWLEEALCEVASLFALRRMADAWEAAPPYPNWAPYAESLRKYAAERLAESPLRPEAQPLAEWYARNRPALTRQPMDDRTLQLAVAAALLPLFEARPARWAALHWLNADTPREPRSFRGHLAAWRRQAPRGHAPTIEAIAAAFGEALPTSPAEGHDDDEVPEAVMHQFDGLVRECGDMKVG